MAKRTFQRAYRALYPAFKDKDGKTNVIDKIMGYEQAAPTEEKEFEYNGVKFSVRVSMGQTINPKKLYKKYLAGKSILNK